MDGNRERGRRRLGRLVALVVGAFAVCWIFPLFHVQRLASVATPASAGDTGAFDPKAIAEKFWREQLMPATRHASELAEVVKAVRADPAAAKKAFGKPAGVGIDYLFVRGAAKVVARERNVLQLAVEGVPGETVELRLGPVFGNTVRDGCGLLDVNAFPGVQEFNALAAELNALVETRVLPRIREKATIGATINFAGCAEAPEFASDAGEPMFRVVPVQAEVK